MAFGVAGPPPRATDLAWGWPKPPWPPLRAGFQSDYTGDPLVVVSSEVALASSAEVLFDSLVPKVVGLSEPGGAGPCPSGLSSLSEVAQETSLIWPCRKTHNHSSNLFILFLFLFLFIFIDFLSNSSIMVPSSNWLFQDKF
jgi:hypothetical protein